MWFTCYKIIVFSTTITTTTEDIIRLYDRLYNQLIEKSFNSRTYTHTLQYIHTPLFCRIIMSQASTPTEGNGEYFSLKEVYYFIWLHFYLLFSLIRPLFFGAFNYIFYDFFARRAAFFCSPFPYQQMYPLKRKFFCPGFIFCKKKT
jgi:hypothetical protein